MGCAAQGKQNKKRKVFFYTVLGYESKVVQFQERGYVRDAQLENRTGCVFSHLDVLISVIVIFRI